ncbi:unnamed protein product [Cylindrotheca closterium]|uniref:Sugar phosphate transporter domain-containing protein n=1 Tax=Cylindrotheca closterium TaxID=2856 RepID=A0AAD2GDP8_9STRA|nr:unnamed protein product [Cylindrotheca closterium]
MKKLSLLQLTAVLSIALSSVISTVKANSSPYTTGNFRVVVDPSAALHNKKTSRQRNGFLSPSSLQHDEDARRRLSATKDNNGLQTMLEKLRVKQRCSETLSIVSDKSKVVLSKCKQVASHYSKAEIGLYASLACALTFALQAVFAKTPCKTLDVGIITYLLSMASSSHYMPIELANPKRTLQIYTTPSVFSTDGKTYIRLIRKGSKSMTYHKKKTIASSSQESQVRMEPVQTFYHSTGREPAADPASHNAVLQNMTPYMRQKLKARRMRGGGTHAGLMERLTIGFYFGAWYALNIVYNIINKKVLNVLPAPLIVGTFQFGIGALYCALVWLVKLRPMPKLTASGKQAVITVGMYHALGQLASMISLGAGPVSFTHIVKAMEPFFSAVVSGLYFKKWMKPQVYLTLVPVVCGVGYACMKELNFSWLAFGAAMSSNLFFALRAVMSKLALSGGSSGTNLTPPNMFGLVTWAAFFLSVPLAIFGEGKSFMGLWDTALKTVESHGQFYKSLVISGLVHYLNNEVMYLALGKVHPVTLAVGNTMKRVFILVASVMVFRNKITVQAGIGSGVGIGGVLLYSLTKQYYENLEQAAAAKAPKTVGKRFRFGKKV